MCPEERDTAFPFGTDLWLGSLGPGTALVRAALDVTIIGFMNHSGVLLLSLYPQPQLGSSKPEPSPEARVAELISK